MAVSQVGFGYFSGLVSDGFPTLGPESVGVTMYQTDVDKHFVWDGTTWIEKPSGISDAPADTKGYGRKDGEWIEVTNAIFP